MALKPTIYKFNIQLSDVDRNRYDTLNMTVVQHPSETMERMMARVMAFCLNAGEGQQFTKGLCVAEEPAIWAHSPDGRIDLWIDVGKPAFDRIKKARRISGRVRVYAFHYGSENWWAGEQEKWQDLDVSVFQLGWQGIQALAAMVERTMELSVTVTDGIVYISAENGDCEIPLTPFQTV